MQKSSLFLSLFFTASIWAQPIESMKDCKVHFRSWARVEKVQLGSLRDAFPATIWEGTLEERISRLKTEWNRNVKVVDDVKFEFKNKEGEITSRRKKKMVVISTHGLNEQDLKDLVKDYTNAVAWLTVSHPMSESGGHLYTRVGNKVFDYYGWFSKNGYEIDSDIQRLEPLIHLSPEEQFRLNTYVKNVNKSPEGVLGGNSYDGAKDATGKLTNNKPLADCGGHNCTSWMGLAPIGDEGQVLAEITGASKSWNIHTNPGWWLQHLTGIADDERVPYVVFFTSEKLSTVTANAVKKNKKFNWDFGLH